MRLDLLRHGDTGRAGHLDGRTDYPLTAAGIRQMERQTACGGWSRIIASPLRRARQPAETLAHRLSCSLKIDPDWKELDFGRWDGRPTAEIRSDAGDRQRLTAYYDSPCDNAPPGGESWSIFETRVRRAIQNAYAEADGQRTLVVTHAGPMRAALSFILGIPLGVLWSIRLGYGTRVGLDVERGESGKLWGELVEIVQP
jgi:alpha-ribazole phosphatase